MELPKVKTCLNTSDNNLIKELYEPCLKWAERYDRGVGYFSSGWLTNNICGLSDFVVRGGTIRLITSPILSEVDYKAIIKSVDEDNCFEVLKNALLENVDRLQEEMEKDVFNALAWMIHDGILKIKFAIPKEKLENGNFHDKFGIFCKGEDKLSFSGSINDSIQGILNYESIKVFKTWEGTEEYVKEDVRRFDRIWNGNDCNLNIFAIPEAVKEHIFSLRSEGRPYKKLEKKDMMWEHQEIAVERFLEKKNGILAMATGTGKTRVALRIIRTLVDAGDIERVIITMYGNDLLDQWAKQVRDEFKNMSIYYEYGKSKMLQRFLQHPNNAILLISRDGVALSKLVTAFEKSPKDYTKSTLFIFDEVHGIGSESIVENLEGKISPYMYRLGLSATPVREYDEEGNYFICEEIGPVIFEFSLENAIQKGILCEFDYIPLSYDLTSVERKKKKDIIAFFETKRKNGEFVKESDLYTRLSLVNKTASMKLIEFEKLISKQKQLLENSIIFVQTKEYGEKVQDILIKYLDKYHTYYADDEKYELENFAKGDLKCLITCKKVSEGIDISRVESIFLFSSDRSKLVTTQRIGRALRLDKNNPEKRARVIDFILDDDSENETADVIRKEWLSELAKTRRNVDEERNNRKCNQSSD